MIKKIILFVFIFMNAYSSGFKMNKFEWESGVSFLKFLENSNIPLSLYYNLSPEDKELTAEIVAGTMCEVLIQEDNSNIEQILIPISDELQIHILRDKNDNFELSFSPIIYEEREHILGVSIEKNPHSDITKALSDDALANEFSNIFTKQSGANFSKLQKGDQIAIHYKQKYRQSRPYLRPLILSGMIEDRGESYYLYYYDSKYYDQNGKMSENFLFKLPIYGARVSSKFQPKRFHPVLKIYRAHLGTDYAAPKGTPIKAAGDGRVIFLGKKGGYGNTVEIQHINGYKTLYAHTKGFVKGLKKGQKVKQGEVIAYVGTTGLSSGPHLHLGLYKNNKAIDFEKVVYKEKDGKFIKEKKKFDDYVKKENQILQKALGGFNNPDKNIKFNDVMDL
ncbi:M23 family metallopeptidase [Campylobacter sp. FMV-PI01]|uniref:M23 family metallopeptidase n=1 Tax=Campylobacter portucalensis TaxID=2608384 RepID=A0A6L5WGJ4_9BACT|nr:peptidoglycan DD-metalloendopeptidase family protein [Campylobacter portucalensis]MSN96298.1 M23 family metallopeptidase [Campylobacter portucalensis]